MHHRSTRFAAPLLALMVTLLIAGPPPATAQTSSSTDPFAYCAAVGTIDAPDARYTGAAMPESVARALQTASQDAANVPLAQLMQDSVWRCMDGSLYACTVGANLPCQDKANTSQTPSPEMTQYCQANPSGDIPAVVTGNTTIYEWSCENGVATRGNQFWLVDARGFIANLWYQLGQPVLPATGGAAGGATSVTMLLVIAGSVALLGLAVRAAGTLRLAPARARRHRRA